ncbi:MAG: GDP-L-fucose synthase [Amphiamblys sp. WSBS2006]|nr:MAG: GDP-L-fucose synthase [Amphiamblys sp. WSBS2006]
METVVVLGSETLLGKTLQRMTQNGEFQQYTWIFAESTDLAPPGDAKTPFEKHTPDIAISFTLTEERTDSQSGNMREALLVACNTLHGAFLANTHRVILCAKRRDSVVRHPVRAPSTADGTHIEETIDALCQSYNREYGTSFAALLAPTVFGPGGSYTPKGEVSVHSLISMCMVAVDEEKDLVLCGNPKETIQTVYAVDAARLAVSAIKKDESPLVVPGTDAVLEDTVVAIARESGFKHSIVFDTRHENTSPAPTASEHFPAACQTPFNDALRETIHSTKAGLLNSISDS